MTLWSSDSTSPHRSRFPWWTIVWAVTWAAVLGLLLFSVTGFLFLRILDKEEIHYAARKGDVASVERILASRPELLEQRSRLDKTPLLDAAWEGQAEVVELLIRRGADLNARCHTVEYQNQGWTALHLAAINGRVEAARVLVRAGADVNARTERGETPLDVAVRNGNRLLADLLRTNGGIRGDSR